MFLFQYKYDLLSEADNNNYMLYLLRNSVDPKTKKRNK